jgi:sigma-B regulation protein RsbU (phosphoserine phosphatase)
MILAVLELEMTLKGQSRAFELADGEHSVGRAGDSTIVIPIARVSKHHAVLRVEGDRLFVRDLGSTNGTEIGTTRIGTDEVEVPRGSVVSFAGVILRRPSASVTLPMSFTGAPVSTLMRYNTREGYSNTARDRIVSLSSELFELLASGEDASVVESAACRFVAKCVSADRVVLLIDQGEGTSIEAGARWMRRQDDGTPLQLSSTIVGQVVSERESLLVANPAEDPRYVEQKSIMFLKLRSAMAAPLFDNERVRGILYVDTAEPTVKYTQDDLQVLTATANAVAVKLRNISLESELRTAARIQRTMIPAVLETPAGFALDAYQVMCRSVGGDLYHCRRRPNGHILLALGDVSGKGTPAALSMSAATVLIGLLAEIGGDLEAIVQHLHRQLFESFSAERFITMFVAELDAESGSLRYVNAGHEPPLLVRASGEIEALNSTGMPLAMMDELEAPSEQVVIEPGDLLAIFSDGIPEATTSGDTFYGHDAMKEVLRTQRDRPLPELRGNVVASVDAFLRGEPNSDDLTLMLLRRNAATS